MYKSLKLSQRNIFDLIPGMTVKFSDDDFTTTAHSEAEYLAWIRALCYIPNGYIVPAEFGVHFPHRMKNVPKRTKMYLDESGLTNTELCKSQIQLR